MGSFLSDPYTFIVVWLKGVLLGWGLSPDLAQLILFIVGAAILAALSLFWVIFLIWVERKIGGRVQDRLGPNRLGPFGLVQPVADMLKIFTKEFITPSGVDRVPYELAPILAVAGVMLVWGVVPFTVNMFGVDLNVGVLYLVAVGGIAEMGIILAGWGSNNKFALLGAFRAIAQLVSYEVPMVVSLLVPVMLAGSMSLNEIVKAQNMWYIVLAPVPAVIFFLSSIAENGRSPFDLLEADSELVSGFNVEYSGLKFGFYFVGDFLHAFTIALIFSVLFLGGWRGPGAEQYPILGFVWLFIKTWIMYLLGLLIRFSLPRFRIDQMMNLNWKLLTPLSLAAVMTIALINKGMQPNNPVVIDLVVQYAPVVLVVLAALVVLVIVVWLVNELGLVKKFWNANWSMLLQYSAVLAVFAGFLFLSAVEDKSLRWVGLFVSNVLVWLVALQIIEWRFGKVEPRKIIKTPPSPKVVEESPVQPEGGA